MTSPAPRWRRDGVLVGTRRCGPLPGCDAGYQKPRDRPPETDWRPRLLTGPAALAPRLDVAGCRACDWTALRRAEVGEARPDRTAEREGPEHHTSCGLLTLQVAQQLARLEQASPERHERDRRNGLAGGKRVSVQTGGARPVGAVGGRLRDRRLGRPDAQPLWPLLLDPPARFNVVDADEHAFGERSETMSGLLGEQLPESGDRDGLGGGCFELAGLGDPLL